MAKPYEQDVILDADGKPLFDAMTILERRIGNIAKTINKLQQDSFKTVNNLNKTIDANVKALNKAQSQMNALGRVGATDRATDRTLARTRAERDAAKYGTTTTRIGYQLELEKKLEALENARTERQKRAALEAVRTAQARLSAIQKIEAAEERVAAVQRRQNSGDALSGHRARLALARQYGEQQVRDLGTAGALTAAKNRTLAAEERLARATGANRDQLRLNLQLEEARERAIQRIVRAQERANKPAVGNPPAPGGPKGPESRLGNILSPGYAAAAFARTSVYGAAAMAAYGTFNAVQEGVRGVVELDDALAKLQAISGSTDTQMQSLRGTIFGIGQDSRFSIDEIAKMSQVLAQAGVSASQMPDVLKSVTRLATASGSTPDEAVQLVTSALGSFQLQASESARVADLMSEALNRTKLTVQQVGQAIQYVGSTAYEQNVTLEQLLATIGAVAQAGVKSGSTIGTGFRQFLVDLQDPSKKLTEQLTLLGLTSADVDVSVRGLPAVLETLQKAGFGASQAYQGLEVRAAAFYLTAKNNVDVIDRLQLAFTQQGAAARANEQAMSSLSAQWQRFKNLLGEKLFNVLEGPLETLKNVLKYYNDSVQEAAAQAEAAERRVKNGSASAWEKFKYDEAQNADKRMEALTNGARSLLNRDYSWQTPNGKHWGDMLLGAENAAAANDKLATKIANANDKIEDQRNRLGELDKELLRIITQKESLRDNEVRTAAETSNLTTRFQGLALNLQNTGNAYDDLVKAMRAYKAQQENLLGADLLAQQANLTLQTAEAQGNARLAASRLLKNPTFAAASGHDLKLIGALQTVQSAAPGSREFNNAQTILVDAVKRFSTTNEKLANKLNEVVQSLGTVAFNTQQMNANQLAIGNARAVGTPMGQFVTNNFQDVEAAIEKLAGMPSGPERTKAAAAATSILKKVDDEIAKKLKLGQTEYNKRFLLEAQQTAASYRKQIAASLAPTSEEKAAANRAAREAERGPRLTQAELDSIASQYLGLPATGSGVRSAATQNALFRAGKTPADAAHSSHSNGGLARDFPIPAGWSDAMARNFANGLREKFKNLGVDVFVQFETGRGSNQGTGRHIHTSAKKGTRWKGSAAGSDAAAVADFESQMDTAQLGLDKRELSEALKDIGSSTDGTLFTAAQTRAKAAMEKVAADLKKDAENDLAKGGIGPGTPQYAARMAQLKDELDQMTDEYNRKVVDALIKGSQNILKAAQENFENALKPSQGRLAMAEGVVSGLGYASNQGKVPDYTMQLAQQQAARAREAADRARMEALPGLINQQQGQVDYWNGLINGGTLDAEGVGKAKDQIVALTNSIGDLQNQFTSLQAAFGAEGLIPTTFRQGLDQAIEAYKEMNGLNLTFTQQLNNELTGAIGAVHTGLTDMFEGIMSGSMTAGQAIMGFARAVMQAITQIVAKIIATQIINLLFSLIGSVGGGMSSSAGVGTGTSGLGMSGPSFSTVPVNVFKGGRIGYATGGFVGGGHSMRDSVAAMLSKGEWVINKRAVDSVGHEFMNDLNNRGSKALENTAAGPKLEVNPMQKVNVWMVKPDEMPSMGPDDVLVTWQQDVLRGGQSRKLIQSIARESR